MIKYTPHPIYCLIPYLDHNLDNHYDKLIPLVPPTMLRPIMLGVSALGGRCRPLSFSKTSMSPSSIMSPRQLPATGLKYSDLSYAQSNTLVHTHTTPFQSLLPSTSTTRMSQTRQASSNTSTISTPTSSAPTFGKDNNTTVSALGLGVAVVLAAWGIYENINNPAAVKAKAITDATNPH